MSHYYGPVMDDAEYIRELDLIEHERELAELRFEESDEGD